MLTYKVIELSSVTEDSIENAINEWVAKGWNFVTIYFAMRESQRRPSMAFLMFTSGDTNSKTKTDKVVPIHPE
ncbi:MAG: DUF4177 domain-containing protein [Desulfuromonadales bacterium]|nr:DUF4177 domain-containing protein [Desulfuromonadales bacterium]